MASRDRHAVKQAEAHAACGAGVVAGWTNDAECIAHLAGEDRIDGGKCAARGDSCAGGALRTDGRVSGAELAAMLRDFSLHKFDVFACVSERQIVIASRARGDR